jgi:hypothetical protein
VSASAAAALGKPRGAGWRVALCGLAVLAASGGCQRKLRETMASIDASYSAGQYAQANMIASGAAEQNGNDEQDQLVYCMAAGHMSQVAGDTARSLRWFGLAYEQIRPYLDAKAEATVSEAIATTAVNQTVRIYRGTPPERIMLCGLQGVNCLVEGNLDAARLELNRARDFQQDAVSRFEQEVAAEQSAAQESWKAEGWDPSIAGSAIDEVRAQQGELAKIRGYASFGNPFVSYMRAVFLIASSGDASDRQNARADLNAVLEMVPGMPLAQEDIGLIDANAPAGRMPVTWIFFLTGLAPRYDEFRLDIPIPVGQVNYVSAAFPVLKVRNDFVDAIEVPGADGAPAHRSVPLADLDAVVTEEFNARLPAIVTQEIISSASKAAATWAASQAAYSQDYYAGLAVQIAGIAYQAASTAADLRCWSTMPKQVGLLRMPTPVDGKIEVRRPSGAAICTLGVRPDAPNIVFLTLPSSAAPSPAVQVARLHPDSDAPSHPAAVPEPAAVPAASAMPVPPIAEPEPRVAEVPVPGSS